VIRGACWCSFIQPHSWTLLRHLTLRLPRSLFIYGPRLQRLWSKPSFYDTSSHLRTLHLSWSRSVLQLCSWICKYPASSSRLELHVNLIHPYSMDESQKLLAWLLQLLRFPLRLHVPYFQKKIYMVQKMIVDNNPQIWHLLNWIF
jgi:hypothetical protein